MCQSAADGGRRCLKHASASNATTRYTWAKTGVDRDTIYGILKDLNKEGRKLDAPQLEEVKEFLRKEEFKTRLDPDLNERDRKLILKNLKKAEEEAETHAMTGGAFHAYRNLFQRTMDRIKKPLLAIGLSGALIAGLSGCGGAMNNTDPTHTAAPEPTQTVACSTLTQDQLQQLGDVVPKAETSDSFGKYCRITINPKSAALTYDASKVDMASLTANGFTEEDAKAAQKTAVEFLTQESLDSTRLDNYSQKPSAWVKENSDLFTPEAAASYEKSVDKDGIVNSGLMISDYLPQPIVRDGGPRSQSINVEVTKIVGTKTKDGKNLIIVYTSFTSAYKASDAEIVKSITKSTGKSEADLKASNPELFDGNDTGLLASGVFNYAFQKGSLDKIAGTFSKWSLKSQDGKSPLL